MLFQTLASNIFCVILRLTEVRYILLYFNVLLCIVVYSIVLQCIRMYCNLLYYIVVWLPFLRQLYSSNLIPPPQELLHHLCQSIESEIRDKFWSSWCLNDCLEVLNRIGSFAFGLRSYKAQSYKATRIITAKSSFVD